MSLRLSGLAISTSRRSREKLHETAHSFEGVSLPVDSPFTPVTLLMGFDEVQYLSGEGIRWSGVQYRLHPEPRRHRILGGMTI